MAIVVVLSYSCSKDHNMSYKLVNDVIWFEAHAIFYGFRLPRRSVATKNIFLQTNLVLL